VLLCPEAGQGEGEALTSQYHKNMNEKDKWGEKGHYENLNQNKEGRTKEG